MNLVPADLRQGVHFVRNASLLSTGTTKNLGCIFFLCGLQEMIRLQYFS